MKTGLLDFPAEMEADLRRQCAEQIIAAGAPADQVPMIVDLAFHAAQQGARSVMNTLGTSPSAGAFAAAASLAAGLLKGRLGALESALATACRENGGTVTEGSIRWGESRAL